MKNLLVILTTFLFGACTFSNHPDKAIISPSNQKRIIFPVIAKDKNHLISEEDTLIATVGQFNYTITPEGKLMWGDGQTDSLRLKTDVFISDAYLYLKEKTLFIFYTETDYEGATSRLEKIDMQTKNSIWQTEIDGFNLGLPYITDSAAYVSTIGFVGKIDLTTGKYIFQCPELYDHEKYSFNNFDSIVFRDSSTYFLSYNRKGKRIDTVIVNEQTRTCQTRK